MANINPPRDIGEIEDTIKFLEREIVTNPLAKDSQGAPLMFRYLTIRDALADYLVYRKRFDSSLMRAVKVDDEKGKKTP